MSLAYYTIYRLTDELIETTPNIDDVSAIVRNRIKLIYRTFIPLTAYLKKHQIHDQISQEDRYPIAQ